jgi:DnaJ domain
VDPYLILGVRPGTPEHEVAAAYRELAKRWHPDRGTGEERDRRMAEINAAYDLLRATAQVQQDPRVNGAGSPSEAAPRARRRRGAWLPEPIRRALGPELLDALAEGEGVRLVAPVSTWASPQAILAVTDRRLLVLLDDAPVARVRSITFLEIEEIRHHLRRLGGKTATLAVRTLAGRRHAFSGLRPHTAQAIERHVADGRRSRR